MDEKRRKIQKELAFPTPMPGEARRSAGGGIESSAAASGTESPATTERLMEEVCERHCRIDMRKIGRSRCLRRFQR